MPEEYQYLKPYEVLKAFTDFFKEKYGVECISALHHNKRQTNYHIHLIFSERKELPEPEVKIATRNMFYDENGKHCRTKKEILDSDGNVREGCLIIPKGEPYSGYYFEPKNKDFKSKGFLQEIKEEYTDLINKQIGREDERLEVYRKDSIYLPTKKIGKNNPKEKYIRKNNEEVYKWNYQAAFVAEYMSQDHLKVVKQKEIIEPVKESIAIKNDISAYGQIVNRATRTLNRMMREWIKIPREDRPEAKTDLFHRFIDYCRAKVKTVKDRGSERWQKIYKDMDGCDR